MTQEQYRALRDVIETLAIKQFADQHAYAQIVRDIFAVFRQNIALDDGVIDENMPSVIVAYEYKSGRHWLSKQNWETGAIRNSPNVLRLATYTKQEEA